MTKRLILLVTLSLSISATASTQILFANNSATIILQGEPGDLDAPKLFNAIQRPAIDAGDFLTKGFKISAADEMLISIDCKLSKTIQDFGSCTIVVPKTKFSTLEQDKRRVLFSIGLPESAFAAASLTADQNGHVFFSNDRHLGLVIDYTNRGNPEGFRLFFL